MMRFASLTISDRSGSTLSSSRLATSSPDDAAQPYGLVRPLASVSLALLLGIVCWATPASAAQAPSWYVDLSKHVALANTAVRALIKCPESLSGGSITGKACAARQAKVIGTHFSFIMSDAAAGATTGRCVSQLKAIEHVAFMQLTPTLSFAVAQPIGAAANVNARSAIIVGVTSVLNRMSNVVHCMRA